jgi:hypothetical protein
MKQLHVMELPAPIDRHELIAEVERYLTALDVFRNLGCEPTWRAESAPPLEQPQRVDPAITADNEAVALPTKVNR